MLAVHYRDVADDVWSVEVAVVDGDHRLRVRGEVDFSNAGRFVPVVRAALGAGVRTLDASELVFCDVAGIRALVSAVDALPPDAPPLTVTGADGVLATHAAPDGCAELPGAADGRTRSGHMTECIDGSRTAGPLHAAVVYDSDDALRARRRAVRARRPGPRRDDLRRGAVAGAAGPAARSWAATVIACTGASPGLAHRRTGEAYEDCRAFLAGQHAVGRPTRLLTGNDLDGDTDPDRLDAYLRYEAASTAVFRPYGFPWVCLYDRRRHPAQLVDHVGEVHPQLLLADGRPVDSPEHVEPDQVPRDARRAALGRARTRSRWTCWSARRASCGRPGTGCATYASSVDHRPVCGGAGRGGVPRGDRQRAAARPATLPCPGVAVRGRVSTCGSTTAAPARVWRRPATAPRRRPPARAWGSGWPGS